jgi:hypothetical protein
MAAKIVLRGRPLVPDPPRQLDVEVEAQRAALQHQMNESRRMAEAGTATKPPIGSVLPSEFAAVLLNRPIPVEGENLAGRIRVGEIVAADPRAGIQDRIQWVKAIALLPSGWVLVTAHDGSQRSLSPSTVAWVE